MIQNHGVMVVLCLDLVICSCYGLVGELCSNPAALRSLEVLCFLAVFVRQAEYQHRYCSKTVSAHS